MLSKDYTTVLEKAKYIEPEIIKQLWKLMEQYNYPAGTIEHKLFITPGAHILDRYIEATYIDGVEVLTLEIAGRALSVMETGYRESIGYRN